MSRLAVLLTIPLVLFGCSRGYEVEVRNLTDPPVLARISSPHGSGIQRHHTSGRAGPGDRASMYTEVGASERMMLEVDFAGNVGYPATLDLSPGRTIVNVRRADEGARGRITIEEIPRP